MMKRALIVFFLFQLVLSSFVKAEEVSVLESDVAGIYNPLGISLSLIAYKKIIYKEDKNILWDKLYYRYGAQTLITPAFLRAGAHIEWMPVAVLQLRMQIDRLYFTGAFGSLLAFDSSNDVFDDDVIDALEGDEVSGYGERKQLRIVLQGKWQQLVIKNISEWMQYQFPGDGPYYLEREFELLMAVDDDVFSNQLYILFEDEQKAYKQWIGPYHDRVEVDASANVRERLGFTWVRQYKHSVSGFKNARLFLQAGSYIDEPNREDELYIVIGIGGDYQF